MNIYDRIKLRVVWIDYWLRNSILKLFSNLLFKDYNFNDVKNILIFRTGSMGDSICALPAINIVRRNFPDAYIDILTNAGASNLVSIKHLINKNLINDIIDYLDIPKSRLTQIIKKNKYDLFIELPQCHQSVSRQLRNIIWVRMLGIKKAFGWEVAATRVFPAIQDKYIKFENERDRLVNILRKKNFRIYEYEYHLNIDNVIANKIKDLLNEKNINEKNKNVGLVVGAKRQQNRWPLKYFNDVIDYLTEKKFNILLFGDIKDLELTKNLNGEKIYDFCGGLKPLETAEMMKYCQVVISNDTGPMHLSYAVCTPVIAIFSGRDYPRMWYPPENSENFVFRKFLSRCTKCFGGNCNNDCLKGIKPELVIEKIKILNNTLDPYFRIPDKFEKPEYLLTKYKLNKETKILFTIGRISNVEGRKGYDKVIEILPKILKHNPNLVYILAGKYDETEKQRLMKLVQEKSVQNNFIMTGFIEDKELTDYYLLADIFVMPSTQEGFGIVSLEALVCGLTVIAGNKDGSVEALMNGRLGMLVDPDNTDEILKSIINAIENPIANNRIAVLENFGFDQFKKKMNKILNNYS